MSQNPPYTVPYAAPAFGPPPYHMQEGQILMVSFDVDPDAAKRAISPPLDWVSGTKGTAFIGDMFQLPFCGKFHEGGVILRASHRDVEAPYTPYLWTSTDEAMLVGREVYGMPKMMCDHDVLQWSGNQLRGRIKRRQQDVMAIEVNIERQVDPASIPINDSRLSVRTIPDHKGPRSSRREVLHFGLTNYTILEAWEGDATVDFFKTASSKVHDLRPAVANLRGYYLRASWSLDQVEVREEL